MTGTSNVLEALKYTYGVKKLLRMMNEELVTWSILSKQKAPMGGRGQFIMPILTQNPGAFTGISQGGALPTALDPDTAEATFDLQEYVGLYGITWKLIQDSRSDKFAFQQAIQMMDEGLRRRVMRNLNSDLMDDGRGRLAVLPAADNDTTITVNALPRVEKGMVVDLMDTDNATKNTNSATVTAVDPVNRTVTLSVNSGSTGAGDYLVIEDTTDSPICEHTHGLLGAIDDEDPPSIVGDFGNIDRATAGNEYWEAPVFSNGGVNRPFTEDLGLQAMDASREKGGTMIDAWLSNLAIGRRYHEILAAERFFALSAPGTLKGGIGRPDKEAPEDGKSVYEFSGIPWHFEPYFHANTILGLNTKHFYIGVGENEVPRPISEIFEDIPFFRQTANATFEVAWYYQMQLLSDNPASGVKIEDVAEA